MTAAPELPHRVRCHLDRLLADRGMTLVELSQLAGVSVVNLSVLKNDRARAVRFSTLTAVCDALACAPGQLLTVDPATQHLTEPQPNPGPTAQPNPERSEPAAGLHP